MKLIKEYTAVKLKIDTVNQERIASLSYGNIEGPYYSVSYPREIHETEEAAVKYCYEADKYAHWMILPVISFDNF